MEFIFLNKPNIRVYPIKKYTRIEIDLELCGFRLNYEGLKELIYYLYTKHVDLNPPKTSLFVTENIYHSTHIIKKYVKEVSNKFLEVCMSPIYRRELTYDELVRYKINDLLIVQHMIENDISKHGYNEEDIVRVNIEGEFKLS